ncbi:MAG: NADH-quinone oxidoreductase subunit K [Thermoplasmata archaeon]|nr:NADH-quinone oxidoreductase subunit K [Thermoplasmata archaeon]
MAIEIVQTNLLFGFILLGMGLYCVLSKKNLIKMVIGLEIMSKGAILAFVGFGGLSVQAYVVVAIAIEAIVAAVALSIIVNVWKHTKSLDITDMSRLRG